MFKFVNKIFIIIILCWFIFPTVSAGAANIDPAFNPICWKADECEAARQKLGAEKPEEGWLGQEDPCVGDEWGKCLPTTKTVTSISFGGKKEFTDMGDYLLTVYNYVLTIASILAVLMIIVAGVQWTVSGGSSEMIGSAKKRITGALVGLLIAFLSYAILNTLNPNLVKLRLPQVFMIKSVSMMPEFCSQTPSSSLFTLVSKTGTVPTEQEKPIYKYSYSLKPDDFACGATFSSRTSGGMTCKGDFCKKGQVCTDLGSSPGTKKFSCIDGMLAGKISGNAGGQSGVVVGNNIKLIAACRNGDIEEIAEIDTDEHEISSNEKTYSYKFPGVIKDPCPEDEKNGLMGYYLGVEVNDESGSLSGYTGIEGLPLALGTGVDDWFAVGQSAPGSHDCSVNLSISGISLINGVKPECVYNFCTCAGISRDSDLLKMLEKEQFVNHLISLEELQRGYMCNLTINRRQFPAADNEAPATEEMGDYMRLVSTYFGASAAAILGVPGAVVGGGVGAVAGTVNKFFLNNLNDVTSCWENQEYVDETAPPLSETDLELPESSF